MLVAGLLTSDQLAGIFLNTDELIQASDKIGYYSDTRRSIGCVISIPLQDVVSRNLIFISMV